MSIPTDILGKIGKKVGEEIKTVTDDVALKADTTALTAHTSTVTGNPHAVTASDVGLGSVENTALSTWAGSANITTVGTLASGAIPYSLLTNVPNLNSISGDLSISGNLTVNGTQTILKTQTVEVEDNEIELNLGSGGAETAQTSGIAINRGVASSGSGLSFTLAQNIAGNISFTQSITNGTADTDSNGFPYYNGVDSFGGLYRISWDTGVSTILGGAATFTGYRLFTSYDNGSTWSDLNDSVTNNATPDASMFVSFEDSELSGSGTFQSLVGGGNALEDWLAATASGSLNVIANGATVNITVGYDQSGHGTYSTQPTTSGSTQVGAGGSTNVDKAKLQWDDTNSKWSFLVGTTKATVEAGVVAVPDGNGLTINGVSLGDYSEFETAFLAAL
tara:strand:+ start:3190 stop:4365 length:1176 start_codon:yes stop_codon:yes gene_type:complete